jgi:predicted metal-dependent phosphoesterase TrpH
LPLKIDLHVHTFYSYDSTITPKELVIWAKKRGLDAVAITDHDVFDGAAKLSKRMDFLIIPGIEVNTLYGHVLGLDVRDKIPPKFDVNETIEKIHKAGGIAIAAHPTAIYRGKLRRHVTGEFDAVEVMNASSFPFGFSNYINRRIALRYGLPQTGGSDAHTALEIGMAYSLVEAQPYKDSIIAAIKNGKVKPYGKAIPWLMHLRRGRKDI